MNRLLYPDGRTHNADQTRRIVLSNAHKRWLRGILRFFTLFFRISAYLHLCTVLFFFLSCIYGRSGRTHRAATCFHLSFCPHIHGASAGFRFYIGFCALLIHLLSSSFLRICILSSSVHIL